MVPQLQVVGSPKPRKLRLASVNTAEAITSVILTNTGPVALMSMCLKRIRGLESPRQVQASIYCISRIFMVLFFVTRANCGQENIPKMIATLVIEVPITAAIIIISGSMGSVIKMSMKPSITSRSQPVL